MCLFPPIFIQCAQDMLRELPSRCHSSGTLVRGAAVLQQDSMSFEGDEVYQEMVAERQRLLVARLMLGTSIVFLNYGI